jgi:ubiquinone/menaquinone biosynthesis C-methylase UbiE
VLRRHLETHLDASRVLHIAPDPGLLGAARSRIYVTLDVQGEVMVRGDLTTAPFRSGTFDLIVCSHVLEHIVDDMAALTELRRCLGAGGALFLLVPWQKSSDRTYEDGTITSPTERTREFGQSDHVRVYGRDFLDRVGRFDWSVRPIEDGELAESDCLLVCSA